MTHATQEGFAPAGESTEHLLENWLQGLFSGRSDLVEAVAEAMIEDGHATSTAWCAAALGHLRYGDMPIARLLKDPNARQALSSLREHIGPAIEEVLRGDAARAPEPLGPPGAANQLTLEGHRAKVLFEHRHPRVMLLADLLTPSECSALIELAAPRLVQSEITEGESGQSLYDPTWRNSRIATLPSGLTPLRPLLERRLAALAGLPAGHCEGITVAWYGEGGFFGAHTDYHDSYRFEATRGGQRVATVIAYLNEVEEGGATAFPELGLRFRPTAGHALYFDYRLPDGSPDIATLHRGEPVQRGEKWIATFWFREHVLPRNMPGADALA